MPDVPPFPAGDVNRPNQFAFDRLQLGGGYARVAVLFERDMLGLVFGNFGRGIGARAKRRKAEDKRHRQKRKNLHIKMKRFSTRLRKQK
jgi:hypothetical protein